MAGEALLVMKDGSRRSVSLVKDFRVLYLGGRSTASERLDLDQVKSVDFESAATREKGDHPWRAQNRRSCEGAVVVTQSSFPQGQIRAQPLAEVFDGCNAGASGRS